MSYNGSGTFNINSTGQPVVAGTVITASAFNALTTDLATGLTTAITKDGQTTTTARITFAQGITSSLTTDSSSVSTGSIITAGGAGIAKNLYVGVNANVAGTLGVTGVATFSAAPIYSSLTASSAVATDASKGLVSVTNTGTGNNVLATSPTITTPTISSLSSAAATALTLQSAGTTAITVDTSQRVLIGTTSASYGKLVISGASADVAMQIADTASTTAGIGFNGSGSTNGVGAPTGTLYFGQYNGFPMVFTTNNAERMRIDSSGNVGINTTSPNSKLYVRAATNANLRVTDSSGTLNLSAENDAGSAQVAMKFNGSQMMLDASGNLLVGTTSQSSNEKFGVVQSSGSFTGAYFNATAGDYSNVVLAVRCARGSASTEYNFIEATQVSTLQFVVRANGNVVNTNNSYGSLSDVKLKENIVDATPKLADLMQVKVRNYNLKSDPTHKQLGVIAQELEQVFPAMVEESTDKDEEGNDLGTTTKAVKYSVFVPMLIKSIQEQQATINALTARIVALESK